MASVPDLNCIDIGSKKVRGLVFPRLHSPDESAESFSFSHNLGHLINTGEIPDWKLAAHRDFKIFAQELTKHFPKNFDQRLGVSRNYTVATAPARRRELGEFSFATFAKTANNIFPLVLPPELEGKILELAVWSEFSKTKKLLERTRKIVHFHPGGMSLEVNESYDGVLDKTGCQEEFGIVANKSPTDSLDKFEALVQRCQTVLKENQAISNIIDHIDRDTELVFSGRFARKLIRLSKKLGFKADYPEGSDGWIQNSKMERHLPMQLTNHLISQVISNSPGSKDHFEANGRLFMLSMIEAVMREVENRVLQKSPDIIISDARLIHGIAELRRRASFNDEIMPKTVEEHMDAFHYSIPHSASDRKFALRMGRMLHGAIIDCDSPSSVSTAHKVVCEVSAQLAALKKFKPNSHIEALGDFHIDEMFGANRALGMPRLTQESIVRAAKSESNPELIPSGLSDYGNEALWYGGLANGVMTAYEALTIVPENDDEISITRKDNSVLIVTRNPAVAENWASKPKKERDKAAHNLELKEISFSYRG